MNTLALYIALMWSIGRAYWLIPSTRFELDNPLAPYRAVKGALWGLAALVCFVLLVVQLDTP